jgi:excisionase family DNA binding protein
MPTLTIKQAAAALGVTDRTLRRWIAEGELSATKRLDGKRERRMIDGAELARFAETHGKKLRVEDPDTAGHPPDMDGLTNADSPDTTPESVTGPGDSVRKRADTRRHSRTDTDGHSRTVEELREQLRAVTEDRDFLRRALDQALRALPPGEPARAEGQALDELQATVDRQAEENARLRRELERRPWWERLFRGGGPR